MQRHPSRLQMHMSKSKNGTAGFSVVELMVAMALSLLLLGGVVAIFSSSRVAYESTDQMSRVQETGRFALDQLTRHVRAAGFSGCARQPKFVTAALNANTRLNPRYDFLGSPAVLGFDASGEESWTPALPQVIADDLSPSPESDVLLVRGARLDAAPMQVSEDMENDALEPDPNADLNVRSISSINALGAGGSVVMGYSCEGVSFFFATAGSNTLLRPVNASGVPGNATASTSYPFRENAEVVPVETVIYYIDASSEPAPAGMTSLYRQVGAAVPEELVQGVEQMQVEYGVDLDGDRVIDSYESADTVGVNRWDRVLAVRVAMLVSSVEEYGTDLDERTYELLDVDVPAPRDRRLREVFTTTISIRNRVRIE